MGTLWTFGCSFTAEWYPVGYGDSSSTYDEYKKFKGGVLPEVWSTILGKKLNYDVRNCGFGGVSNYNILKQFINVIDCINEGDILIFGWTSLLRFCAVSESEYKIIEMLPRQSYHVNVGFSKTTIDEILINRSQPLWAEEVQGWIKFINDYCRLKNVEVFHWNSDTTLFDESSKFVDDKKYILPPKGNKKNTIINYFTNGVDTIQEETDGKIKDLHLGEFGHIKQADYFYNHIKKHTK